MRDDMLKALATEARGHSFQEALDLPAAEPIQTSGLRFVPNKREQLGRGRGVMRDRRAGETTNVEEVLAVGVDELGAATGRRRAPENAASIQESGERPHRRAEGDIVLRILRREADEYGGGETADALNTAATQRLIDSR